VTRDTKEEESAFLFLITHHILCFGHWNFGIDICLEFGAWDLVL
jgi:hypothetical protein